MPISTLVDRLVAIRTASSPTFAKDGTRLFHLADDSGIMQIWSCDLAGGARRQLTFHDEPVGFFSRSPRDDTIVYGTDRGGDERQQLHLLHADGGAGRPLTRRPEAIHSWGGFSRDGTRIAYTSNARNGVDFDLYVMDLASGAEHCLLELAGLHAVSGWSPDGATIAVIEERSHFDLDVRLVDAATGTARLLPRPHGMARYATLRWRKDGSGFYCLTELGGEHLGIASCDLADGSFRGVLMLSDAEIDALSLSPDGTTFAATVNRQGWSELVLVASETGTARAVAGLPPGVVGDFAWSPDGARLAFALTAPTLPRALWMLDLATGVPRQILGHDGAASARFVDWRLDAFATFDGRQIPTWHAVPDEPASEGGRKAVIWVHGGPENQTRPVFRSDIQALLARGYEVMLPNVRGSTGYGRSYAALDDGRLRLDAVEDLREARLWFGRRPGIDESAIAVMGQSYGGFMVLATIARHPELWKAAIKHYGFASFLTELRDTGPWRRRHRAAEYGDPERDRDFLHEASPLTHAHRITAPLFVSHGLRDPRVPPSETAALVAALRARGQPVEQIIIPHAGHGYVNPDHRRAVWGGMLDFLDRHL